MTVVSIAKMDITSKAHPVISVLDIVQNAQDQPLAQNAFGEDMVALARDPVETPVLTAANTLNVQNAFPDDMVPIVNFIVPQDVQIFHAKKTMASALWGADMAITLTRKTANNVQSIARDVQTQLSVLNVFLDTLANTVSINVLQAAKTKFVTKYRRTVPKGALQATSMKKIIACHVPIDAQAVMT